MNKDFSMIFVAPSRFFLMTQQEEEQQQQAIDL